MFPDYCYFLLSSRGAREDPLNTAEVGGAIALNQALSQTPHGGDGRTMKSSLRSSNRLSHNNVHQGSQGSVGSVTLGKEVLDLKLPPGTLGLILDSPDTGWPLVHDIKSFSVANGLLKVGDRLVSIEGKDVRTIKSTDMSAIMNKPHTNPRMVTIFRGDD